MSRVLLVGVGPMPRADLRRVYATGLRLHAFLKALTQPSNKIAVAEFSFGNGDYDFRPLTTEDITHHILLPGEISSATEQLDSLIEAFHPDCIVALTDIGGLVACRSTFSGPIHVDYFGLPMAERQQQAATHGSDASLADQWLSVLPVLLRADRFSACSNDQRLALMGELGAAGRLNKHTINSAFVEIIPPVLPFDEPLALKNPRALIDKGIPADARIVLCSGGYNTWVDEETLFAGIEKALLLDPALHFVSTGGKIEGHVERVYSRFEARVKASPVCDRMHLLGWVSEEEFEDILLLSHVGVNCDFKSYEGEVGCRNRLYGWLWAGMRVVTTVTSEPTRHLVDQDFVVEIPFGSSTQMAESILSQCNIGRRENLSAFQQSLREKWGWQNFFGPLCTWVANPSSASDRASDGTIRNPLADLQRDFLAFAKASAQTNQRLDDAVELANRLAGSRAFQMYAMLHPEVRDLLEKLKSSSSD